MRTATLLLAISISVPAHAVPMELSHQGRLMDPAGTPLAGAHDLSFSLYDAPAGGVVVWSDTITADFDDGYFTVKLGSGAALDEGVFADDDLYLELSVAGGPPLQRTQIVSVPFAVRAAGAATADVATDLTGGIVDATEIRVNGTTIIDSSGQIDASNLPTDFDSLDNLACSSAGEVAEWDGSTWNCAPNAPTHSHDASEVTTGTMTVARLPVGTGSSEVAAGDHVHNFPELLGTLAASQMPADINGGTTMGSAPLAVLGDVTWSQLPDKPADLADGQIDWSEVQGVPGPFADGQIGWGEVQSMPGGFADGTDDTMTNAQAVAAVEAAAVDLAAGSTVQGDLEVTGVIKDGRPWFMASSSAGWMNCAAGWDNYVTFNQTKRGNAGSWYNTGNGRFTAPVTGLYFCSTNLYNHRRGVGANTGYQHFSYTCGGGLGTWCDMNGGNTATHDIYGYWGSQGSTATLNSTRLSQMVYMPAGSWIQPRTYCSVAMSWWYGQYSTHSCVLMTEL